MADTETRLALMRKQKEDAERRAMTLSRRVDELLADNGELRVKNEILNDTVADLRRKLVQAEGKILADVYYEMNRKPSIWIYAILAFAVAMGALNQAL